MNIFRKNFIFFFSLLRISFRASISVRAAFLFECGLMIVNNLVFVLMWWIFFKQFKEVSGWTLKDLIVLNAVAMGSYGLMQVCFGGMKQLSRTVMNGDLDPYMTQPKNLLIHLLGSKSLSKGWGQIMTSCLLMSFGKLTTIHDITLIIIGIASGSLVFTSVGVIAHSLVFWLGSVETVSKKYCDSLFLFALYPSNIYSGLLELVMFTLIPAGIIGYIPVELVRSFSWLKLLILMGSSIGFFVLSFFIFHLGLKRYESGNQFGRKI